MNERTLTLNDYQLDALGILVLGALYEEKERLKRDEFVYHSDKMACIEFIETLEELDKIINKGGKNE